MPGDRDFSKDVGVPTPEKPRTAQDVLNYLEDALRTFNEEAEIVEKLLRGPSLQETVEAARKKDFSLAVEYLRIRIEISQAIDQDFEIQVPGNRLKEMIALRNCLLN